MLEVCISYYKNTIFNLLYYCFGIHLYLDLCHDDHKNAKASVWLGHFVHSILLVHFIWVPKWKKKSNILIIILQNHNLFYKTILKLSFFKILSVSKWKIFLQELCGVLQKRRHAAAILLRGILEKRNELWLMKYIND